jgi:hypothetical protein
VQAALSMLVPHRGSNAKGDALHLHDTAGALGPGR